MSSSEATAPGWLVAQHGRKHSALLSPAVHCLPRLDASLACRLELAVAVDLKDNFIVEDLGCGYSRITPIDPTKRFRMDGAPSR